MCPHAADYWVEVGLSGRYELPRLSFHKMGMGKTKKTYTGICVSPGTVRGRIRIYKQGVRYTARDIVLLDEWLTSGVALLKGAGGLISSKGGLTCHASVIAREYGIPCLVGVRGADRIPDGSRAELNAASERLTLL